MFIVTIPGDVCATIHEAYSGPGSTKAVQDHIRNAIRQMIEGAIHAGLAPLKLPPTTSSGISFNLSFPAALDRVLRQHSRAHGCSMAEAALGYLYAALARGDAAAHRACTKVSALTQYVLAAGYKPRTHQSLFFDCIEDTLIGKDKKSRRIGLIEGATGLGKTLAIVAAAAETLKSSGAHRVAVATPTIQLLRAYVVQHRKLAAVVPDFPEMRVILGRNEFICVADLESALQEGRVACDPNPIRAWLGGGGAARGTGEDFGLPYLCASLEAVSPGFPVEGVKLNQDSAADDPAAQSYARQFGHEGKKDAPEILYCTHAMLGVDIRRRMQMVGQSEGGKELHEVFTNEIGEMAKNRKNEVSAGNADESREIGKAMAQAIRAHVDQWAAIAVENDFGHLPPWQFLIMDEAHQFESNLANLLATNISLLSYVRKLKGIVELPKKSVTAAMAALRKIGELTPDEDEKSIDLAAGGASAVAARAALAELAEAFCSARNTGSSAVAIQAGRIAKDIKRALQITASDTHGMRVHLEFSPVRAFPQLSYGRESVNKELHFLWATAQAAACVSATLYLRRLDRDSGAYMASLLNVPRERLQEYPPIRPEWTYEPVVGLWVPEKQMVGKHLWLCPPTRSDRLEAVAHQLREKVWLDEVADAVRTILPSAAGGTLILMTSYAGAAELGHRLQADCADLVVANPDVTLIKQRDAFVAMSGANRHPVWIAVGGAWTGLDINGYDFGYSDEEDNLLTDLIIPRFPFRLNRSITHSRRMELGDTPWELLDVSMRFKQGLGRLVRREGLSKNRRIHVLDTRIHADNLSNYLSPLDRIMKLYPRKTLFK